MTPRRVRSRLVAGITNCWSCGWQTSGTNAMGNAARHSRSTGHKLTARLDYAVGPVDAEREARGVGRAGERLL